MTKQKTLDEKTRRRANRRRQKALALGVIGLIAVVSVVSIGNPWGISPGTRKFDRWLNPAPSPQPLTTLPEPSKEYIYAGGRLIAVESGSNLLAPSMAANSLTHLPVPEVEVIWNAVPGAHHYEVEKATYAYGTYTVVNSNVTTTTLRDTNVTPVTSYMYRVRAVDAQGNFSVYSNGDIATAISFTDHDITNQTLIKAAHMNEMSAAAKAIYRLATNTEIDLGPDVGLGSVVEAAHIDSIRSAINSARQIMFLKVCGYQGPFVPQETPIMATHITLMRKCVM